MERFTLVCFGVVLLASVTYSCGSSGKGVYLVRPQPQTIVVMMPPQDSGGSSTGTPSAQETNSIRRIRAGDTGVIIPPSPSPNHGTGTGNGNTVGPSAGPYSGNGNNPGNVTGATVVRANIEGRGTLQTLILSRSGQPGVAIIQPQSPDQDTGTNNGNAAIPPTVPNNGNDINPGNSNGNNPGNDNGNSPGNGNGNNPGTLPAPRSATVLESLARIEGRGTLLHTSRRRRSCQQTPTVVLVQQTQPNQSTGSQPDTGNATGITTGSGTSSNTSSSTFTGSGTIAFIPAESAAINNGNTSPQISKRRRREDNAIWGKEVNSESSKIMSAKAGISAGGKAHEDTSKDGSGEDKGIFAGKAAGYLAKGEGFNGKTVSHHAEHALSFDTNVGEKSHETAEQASSSATKLGGSAVKYFGAHAGLGYGQTAKFVDQSSTHARAGGGTAASAGVTAGLGLRADAKSVDSSSTHDDKLVVKDSKPAVVAGEPNHVGISSPSAIDRAYFETLGVKSAVGAAAGLRYRANAKSVDRSSTHNDKLGVKDSKPAVVIGKLNHEGISSPSAIDQATVETQGAGSAQVTKLGEEHAGRVVGPAHAVEGALGSIKGEHGKTWLGKKQDTFVQHSVAVNGSVGASVGQSEKKEVKVLKQSKE